MSLSTMRSVGALSMLALAASSALAHEHFYDVVLTSAAPGGTAIGTALVTFDLDLITARVEASFSGLAGGLVGVQLHCCSSTPGAALALGALAVTAPAGLPLGLGAGSFDISYDLADGATYTGAFIAASGGMVVDALNALANGAEGGLVVLSFSSSAFPGGEISGLLVEQVPSVPEPAAYAMLIAGLATMSILVRRRRQA
jgi:hypothetical protein